MLFLCILLLCLGSVTQNQGKHIRYIRWRSAYLYSVHSKCIMLLKSWERSWIRWKIIISSLSLTQFLMPVGLKSSEMLCLSSNSEIFLSSNIQIYFIFHRPLISRIRFSFFCNSHPATYLLSKPKPRRQVVALEHWSGSRRDTLGGSSARWLRVHRTFLLCRCSHHGIFRLSFYLHNCSCQVTYSFLGKKT
jgi:hypothetical protein